jgi:hypothetical protein
MPQDVICGDSCMSLPGAGLLEFGVIGSAMHMAWVRAVCGRLKSDFRYSKDIVYDNFPWPGPLDAKVSTSIVVAAQNVLDARAAFPSSTLAELYDADVPTPVLVKAHQQLDKAVDAAYIAAEKAEGRKAPKLSTDAERVAFLFERYQALTSLLPAAKAKKPRAPRRKSNEESGIESEEPDPSASSSASVWRIEARDALVTFNGHVGVAVLLYLSPDACIWIEPDYLIDPYCSKHCQHRFDGAITEQPWGFTLASAQWGRVEVRYRYPEGPESRPDPEVDQPKYRRYFLAYEQELQKRGITRGAEALARQPMVDE